MASRPGARRASPARGTRPARRSVARRASGRGKLAPREKDRGLAAAEVVMGLDSAELAELAGFVRAAGGAPIGAYHEPLGGRPLLLACLPIGAVQPTPFQRDLSP